MRRRRINGRGRQYAAEHFSVARSLPCRDVSRWPLLLFAAAAAAADNTYLQQQPTNPLPGALVGRVLADGEAALKNSRAAAVQHVRPQKPARLVVVGDTHGQLEDMEMQTSYSPYPY